MSVGAQTSSPGPTPSSRQPRCSAAVQDDVANAQIVAMNEAGTGAQIMVTPSSSPDDVATEDLLQALRDGQSDIEAASGTQTGVTGLTAITTDVSERLADALPIYLAVVIGLAFILLMLVFRSILIPLTATLGFLLANRLLPAEPSLLGLGRAPLEIAAFVLAWLAAFAHAGWHAWRAGATRASGGSSAAATSGVARGMWRRRPAGC